ncbi:MAG: LysR substrate-binding domain-containing protein [Myxococcota bacterium]
MVRTRKLHQEDAVERTLRRVRLGDGGIEDEHRPVLGEDAGHRHLPPARWLEQPHPGARVVAHADSANTLFHLARSGIGVAVLPCVVAEDKPSLARRADVETPDLEGWVLTHPELRRVPRVRVVLSALADHLVGRVAAARSMPNADSP